jgi:hypothetical protein
MQSPVFFDGRHFHVETKGGNKSLLRETRIYVSLDWIVTIDRAALSCVHFFLQASTHQVVKLLSRLHLSPVAVVTSVVHSTICERFIHRPTSDHLKLSVLEGLIDKLLNECKVL